MGFCDGGGNNFFPKVLLPQIVLLHMQIVFIENIFGLQKFIYSLLLICLFSACGEPPLKRTESGLLFRVYPSGYSDSFARMGQTVKLHYTQQVGDRIIETTRDKMPLYYLVMPGYPNHYNPLEVLDYGLSKGDSVITIQRIDSMLNKKIFASLPPWMELTDEWITLLKVVEVFTYDSLLQADKELERKRVMGIQQAQSKNRIKDYLAKNNIRAKPDTAGVFVEKMGEGHLGALAETKSFLAMVEVRTIKDSLVLPMDTITMSLEQPVFPPPVQKYVPLIEHQQSIRVFLPAVLITGPEPAQPKIKADDDLVYYIRRIS